MLGAESGSNATSHTVVASTSLLAAKRVEIVVATVGLTFHHKAIFLGTYAALLLDKCLRYDPEVRITSQSRHAAKAIATVDVAPATIGGRLEQATPPWAINTSRIVDIASTSITLIFRILCISCIPTSSHVTLHVTNGLTHRARDNSLGCKGGCWVLLLCHSIHILVLIYSILGLHIYFFLFLYSVRTRCRCRLSC